MEIKSRMPSLSDGTSVKIIIIAAVVAAVILVIDLSLPLGVAGGVPYVVLVLMGIWFSNPRHTYFLAALGSVLTLVGYYYSPDGGVLWIVLTNRGEALFAIWITAILIASRKKYENALRWSRDNLEAEVAKRTRELKEKEAHFRAVTQFAHDGIVSADSNGLIIQWNQGAQQMFGYEAEEIIGQPLSDLVPERYQKAHMAGYARFLEGGKRLLAGAQIKGEASQKNGGIFPVEITLSDWRLDGQIFVTAVIRDISEREATESHLRRAMKMESIGNLTGGVAHEFNNLLLGILGPLEILKESHDPDDAMNKWINLGIDSALRGRKLVRSLLAFSRNQELEVQATNINKVIEKVLTTLGPTLGENIAITHKETPDLWNVMINPEEFEGVILNLAINARDAMTNGGTLAFRSSNLKLNKWDPESQGLPAGDYVALSVVDSGNGMSPETIERAFDPFFTTKEVGKGSGLGLSMVYGFAKQSGGAVHIESKLGKGTTVTLLLPRSMAKEDKLNKAPLPKNDLPGGSEVVLLVEDDPTARMIGIAILENLGYRTIEAEDGASALEILNGEDSIDLLVSDVVMPGGMSGLDLAKQVQTQDPEMKILLCTGYNPEELDEQNPEAAAFPIIRKPYRKEEMATKLRELLDGGA